MKKLFMGCLVVAGLASTGLADALSLSPAVPTAEWTKKWWLTRFDEKKTLAATSRCDVVFWCDFNDKLVPNGDGIPPQELLRDGVHPSEKGYDIWAAEMMPLVRKLLAD